MDGAERVQVSFCGQSFKQHTPVVRLRTRSTLAVLVVDPTFAPRCLASWMANVPMPPEPAGMNTFWPGLSFARSLSACHDVSPTIGIEAACTKSRLAGL